MKRTIYVPATQDSEGMIELDWTKTQLTFSDLQRYLSTIDFPPKITGVVQFTVDDQDREYIPIEDLLPKKMNQDAMIRLIVQILWEISPEHSRVIPQLRQMMSVLGIKVPERGE